MTLRIAWTQQYQRTLKQIKAKVGALHFSPSTHCLCELWSMKSGSFPRNDITTLCSVTNDDHSCSNGNIKFPLDMCSTRRRIFLISLSGLCLPLLLCLYLPQPFPHSSVSLRPGDGGWHHSRFWHHCLQRLVRLHRGQTWKVGSVCLCVCCTWSSKVTLKYLSTFPQTQTFV